MNFRVVTSGSRTDSRPYSAYTTRGTQSTTLTAERVYVSAAQPTGKPVANGTGRTSPCGARNGSQSCIWGGSTRIGYSSFETTANEISIFHEVKWRDREFPGEWYFFGKSLSMVKTGLGYRTTNRTPADATRGGWRPV